MAQFSSDKSATRYVISPYDQVRINFLKDSNNLESMPEFSDSGWYNKPGEADWLAYSVISEESTGSWQNIKSGDIVTIHTKDYHEPNKTLETLHSEGASFDDEWLHIEIVVGWGPENIDFEDWQDTYTGELYATWGDIPQERLNETTFVPYVMDRGSRHTAFGTEDYAVRGPRPFHSNYSISYMLIWVARQNELTRR